MKKSLLLCFSLITISFLTAQTLVSEPTSFRNVGKPLIFMEGEREVFKVPTNFSYNHQLKKRTKVMTIEGELYYLVYDKTSQSVYKKGRVLVAKINNRKGEIYFTQSNKKYTKLYKAFQAKQYYLDEDGTKVVSAKVEDRGYKISTKQEAFTDQKLLMALNLHQLLKIRKETAFYAIF